MFSFFFSGGAVAPPATWTPADGPATALWFDAADASTILNPNGVEYWNDKSGNARHGFQGESAFRPITGGTTLNSKNVLTFGNVSQAKVLNHASVDFLTGHSLFYVVRSHGNGGKLDNWIHSGLFGSGGATAAMAAIYEKPDNSVGWGTHHGGNLTSAEYPSTHNDWRILTHQPTALWRNGNVETLGSSTAVPAGEMRMIGGLANDPGSRYFLGDIAEIVCYTTTLSTADREKVEGYLAWKWGLVALLPAGHTYKTYAPGTTPPAVGGKPKVWTGAAWAEKPVKVWTGSAWQEKPLKFWNGTTWTLV